EISLMSRFYLHWIPYFFRLFLGFLCCFFFFQAEDGIRDFHVTGVQTCALPIFRVPWLPPADPLACRLVNEIVLGEECDSDGRGRSEERRVGKECRSRWSPEQ